VLRMRPEQEIIVFNGVGGEYRGTIHSVNKKEIMVKLDHWSENNRASNLHIHLGQVISRGERMDYSIQKSVELGVTEITPLFSRRCEVKLRGPRLEKRLIHWRNLVISACEQSGLNKLPRVNPPINLSEWPPGINDTPKYILHPGKQSSPAFLTRKPGQPPESVTILAGPEGGFDDHELQQAEQQGFQYITLGPRVFRTETAAVVMLSLLQATWGDLR
jgi:16S rRNA (uracil1498-N3)-methyltransferase